MGIDIGIGHAAQQQHHIALRLPRLDERMESLGNCTGLGLRALLRTAAGNEQRLPTRRLCLELVFALIARLKIQKSLHEATVVTIKDASHVAQHLVVTAEVAHEFDELAGGGIGGGRSVGRCLDRARGTHLALLTAEDLDLGATEAIDRLLCIAHGAQRALARARQIANQVDLHLVGILELVDHDHLKAALVGSPDGGIVT